MVRLIKHISLYFAFFLMAYSGFAQINIRTDEVNLMVPHFEGDLNFTDSSEVLVRKKVLTPLAKSKSQLEIRIFNFPNNTPGPVRIVKLDKGRFKVDEFSYYLHPNASPTEKNDQFENLGHLPENPTVDIMLNHNQEVKLNGIAWDEFFKTLINEHFFDLPEEKLIVEKVKKVNPNITPNGGSSVVVHIKLNNQIRKIIFSTFFGDRDLGVPEYQNIIHIYSTLLKIY